MNEIEIIELKQEYNKYLLRHFKAWIYLEDNNISHNQREAWIPEYQTILNNLNRILNTMEIYNIKYTYDEAMGGFNIPTTHNKAC